MATVIAFAIGAVTTAWFVFHGANHWLIDYPNERSLHSQPISRAGGIAIFAGIAGGLAAVALIKMPTSQAIWIFAGAVIIASISFADDLRQVSPAIRIIAHLAAGACVAFAGLVEKLLVLPGAAFDLGPVTSVVFTVLFVAWLVNLYNFMDGMDGLTGGMTAIGFAALALLGIAQGMVVLTAVSLVVAAASCGFLLFNFPPAKIFMGDLGASFLGYLCAVMMLWAEYSAFIPLWISALIFSPFIVDASVTLVRRIIAGKTPWQAHCDHFYQRLVRLGWGHRKTVIIEYSLMLACACSAIVIFQLSTNAQATLLSAWTAIYLILILGISCLEQRTKIHRS